jgi:hypothetical protein
VSESPEQPDARTRLGPEDIRVPADQWWAFVDAAAARWEAVDEVLRAALAAEENLPGDPAEGEEGAAPWKPRGPAEPELDGPSEHAGDRYRS